MKKKLLSVLTLISVLLVMTNTVYASDLTWEEAPGHHNQSVLLEQNVSSSKDVLQRYARGEYLSMGTLEIVNQKNGSIYICVETYAHVNVDRICHSVFLDQWDEDEEDWIQVAYWEFERTKEEEASGELSFVQNTLLVSDCPVNKYYRVRGLHMVELGDEIEGCATETNGVLITDH